MAGAIYNLNALNPVSDINSIVELIRKSPDQAIAPDLFYNKQLLDTIRLDANEFVFYRLADSQPIGSVANSNLLRRWAPLQAHTVPLAEGVPPASDKGSVETYQITAGQYGRYMEFTDKVDFAMVDPIIAHYTKEYSIVAIETLDLLAREALEEIANPYYAGMKASVEDLTFADKPSMTDLRKIVLSFDKQLVKPRSGNRFHVIAGPEFYYDMIDDPTVVNYMKINNTTKTMYEDSMLVPMFRLEFYQTLTAPASGEFYNASGKKCLRLFNKSTTTTSYITVTEDAKIGNNSVFRTESGYVKDSRTGQDASYIPLREVWDIDAINAIKSTDTITGFYTSGSTTADADNISGKTWAEFKVASVYVIGKDALVKTGLSGQDSAKMFVKPLGSAGVLDPIDQRQSIGFKINSVGFGSTRLEAVVRYLCVPTQLNLV